MKKLLYVLILCLAMIQCAFAAVDINTASEAELDKLPGVGPVKAKAIIEERTKNGKFTSIEDIKRVKGIGDATFDKLKSEISVGGAGAAAAAAAAPVKADSKAEKKADKKAEAKAQVKVDSKPEAKTETKVEATADKKSKAEKKAESKAEAKSKGKSDTKDEARK